LSDQPYTLARWVVRDGEEDAFVVAWWQLAAFFLSLREPPRWGTLLRSAEDPRLFYSFGPWPRMETIAAMRAHPETPFQIGQLTAMCEESALGTFLVAATAGEPPRLA
jgi:hypothetical protein